jgi:hypothetical protein
MTDREFVLQHWPKTVGFQYGESYVILLDSTSGAGAWDVFDFDEPDEETAWAKAAECTRGLFTQSANLQEEITRCEELSRDGHERDKEIFGRIIERLRLQLAELSKRISTGSPLSTTAFPTLNELVAQITPENRYTESDAGISGTVGKEATEEWICSLTLHKWRI